MWSKATRSWSQIDEVLARGQRVQAGRVEPVALAAGRELVARDAREVGGVDEELLLGDTDRQRDR